MADYIDRQAAIEKLQNNIIYMQTFGVDRAVTLIDEVPSADVQPVRHGHWIKVGWYGRSYKCNQCGNFLDFDGVNVGRGDANYCPNCGARMDGE